MNQLLRNLWVMTTIVSMVTVGAINQTLLPTPLPEPLKVMESTEHQYITSQISVPVSPHEPNEMGEVLILMYHQIGEENRYSRSPENFIRDMELLYENQYRPIRLIDLARGNITTPKGFTPFAITFDDGNDSDLRFNEDGSIDETSAVGLLQSLQKRWPDFHATATFFITGEHPKDGQLSKEKIQAMIDAGMDVGNHTRHHQNLTDASKETLQEELALQHEVLLKILPDDCRVNMSSIPYSVCFTEKDRYDDMLKGSFESISYEYGACAAGGFQPSVSMYDMGFDIRRLSRVVPTELDEERITLHHHLKRQQEDPNIRFISDGNPKVITVRESDLSKVKECFLNRVEVVPNEKN